VNRPGWRSRLVTLTGLVIVWVLLWGSLTWLTVAGGVLVALVVTAVFPLPPITFDGRIRPGAVLTFAGFFLRDLVVASAQIAWLAVRAGGPPRSAVIAVPLRVPSDLILTLTAEALSLIPGSLIVEADRSTGTLYVHVIGVRSMDDVERARRSVVDVETRIVRAIGSNADRLRLEGAPR
jgi:multicomponent Na+:H+ antiporter subunit E